MNEELEKKEQTAEDVLNALLSTEHVVQKKIHMKRFGVDFTICAVDGKVIDRISERCTRYVGKGSKRTKEMDELLFGALLIKHGCVEPKWDDQRLLTAYQTHDAADVIKLRLLAGEISKLTSEIMTLSGYEDDEDSIDTVKN
jgi:hypothetical protein